MSYRPAHFLIAFFFLCSFPTPLLAEEIKTVPPLVGKWEGAILLHPAELEVGIALEISYDNQELSGEIAFPTQSAAFHRLSQVDFHDSVAQWIYKDPSGDPTVFTGSVSKDGQELVGSVLDGGKTLNFSLRRATAHRGDIEVARLAPDGSELRSRFDRDLGNVRLLLVLSPTCNSCKNSARLVQTYVLDRIHDRRLRVYVVWEHVGATDTQEAAREAAGLVTDPRASHYWADHRFTGDSFRAVARSEASAPWDLALLFGPQERWRESAHAPAPSYFVHNHGNAALKAESRTLNGLTLAAKMTALLETATMNTEFNSNGRRQCADFRSTQGGGGDLPIATISIERR